MNMPRRTSAVPKQVVGDDPDSNPKTRNKPRSSKALQLGRVPPKWAFRVNLALAITEARLAKGLTQAELAKLADTRQNRISELESLRGNPRISTVQKVAEVLGLDLRLVEK
jgi:ribosome-binding protein aMBF1 (putative translation factor)